MQEQEYLMISTITVTECLSEEILVRMIVTMKGNTDASYE